MNKTGYFLLLLYLAVVGACNNAKHNAPDVSHISVKVEVARFDQDFMAIDSTQVPEGLSLLHQKYPTFLPIYLGPIMNYGPYSDTSTTLAREVTALITSRDVLLLQDTVNAHFPDMNKLQTELRQGFRYMKYYFPSFHPPKVVTFISGLANYGAVTADTVLGIGLDMFLGKDFVPYTRVVNPYPAYMLKQFSPEFIAVDCFKVLQQQMFPMRQSGTLLELMIDHGKQLYFMDEVMPKAPDSIKIGFTQKQLQWCKENEEYIWQYLVQNNLLYESDMQKIMHYIGPGPNTQGMPPVSPGNIGSWVGWQIVRGYMKAHKERSLIQLMKDTNAQKILSEARYRPH